MTTPYSFRASTAAYAENVAAHTHSAADLTSGILPSARLQGNYLNDVRVIRVSSAVYAENAAPPANMVTTNTDQTITGVKTFTSSVTVTASEFSVGGSTLVVIAGNVGIGTTAPTAGFRLDVIGAVRCESLTQYSSKDYKKDIQVLSPSDYQDILKKLEQTEVFRFRYKEADENSKLRLGLIAEESPEEIVSVEGRGIDLGETVSFLIAAIKPQSEEIKALKAKLNDRQ